MSNVIKQEAVTGPLGEFEVSTILAPGHPDYSVPIGMMGFFAPSVEENPWACETMIFRTKSRTGLYHEAYADKESAIRGHARMVETIKNGAEFGGGVDGPFGNPTLTAEQWNSRMEVKANA